MRNFLAQIVVLSVLIFGVRIEGAVATDNFTPISKESVSNSRWYIPENVGDINNPNSQNINNEKNAYNLAGIPNPAAYAYINDTAATIETRNKNHKNVVQELRSRLARHNPLKSFNPKRLRESSTVVDRRNNQPAAFETSQTDREYAIEEIPDESKTRKDNSLLYFHWKDLEIKLSKFLLASSMPLPLVEAQRPAKDWALFFNIATKGAHLLKSEQWTIFRFHIYPVHLLLEFRNVTNSNCVLNLLFLPTKVDSSLITMFNSLAVEQSTGGVVDNVGQRRSLRITLTTSSNHMALSVDGNDFMLVTPQDKNTTQDQNEEEKKQQLSRIWSKSRNMLSKVLAPLSFKKRGSLDSLEACSKASMLHNLMWYHTNKRKSKKNERYCLHDILKKNMRQWKGMGDLEFRFAEKVNIQDLEQKYGSRSAHLINAESFPEISVVFTHKRERLWQDLFHDEPNSALQKRRKAKRTPNLLFYPETTAGVRDDTVYLKFGTTSLRDSPFPSWVTMP